MAGQKPNNFNALNTLDGLVEFYTQRGDDPRKFTLDVLVDYLNDNLTITGATPTQYWQQNVDGVYNDTDNIGIGTTPNSYDVLNLYGTVSMFSLDENTFDEYAEMYLYPSSIELIQTSFSTLPQRSGKLFLRAQDTQLRHSSPAGLGSAEITLDYSVGSELFYMSPEPLKNGTYGFGVYSDSIDIYLANYITGSFKPYGLGSMTMNMVLPIADDNAAAILNGLVIGDIYRTTTGELRMVI